MSTGTRTNSFGASVFATDGYPGIYACGRRQRRGGGYQAQRKKTGMLGDFLITPCIRRKFAEAFEMRITLVNRKVAAMNRES